MRKAIPLFLLRMGFSGRGKASAFFLTIVGRFGGLVGGVGVAGVVGTDTFGGEEVIEPLGCRILRVRGSLAFQSIACTRAGDAVRRSAKKNEVCFHEGGLRLI